VGVSAWRAFPGPWRLAAWVLALTACAGLDVARAGGQQLTVRLDPAATQIHFTLAATLHTVHGRFQLKSGEIEWDTASGHAMGLIVVDVTSGATDNASRDKNMHAQVLESAKFPDLTFTPSEIKGTLYRDGASALEASGMLRVHGQDHAQTLALAVEPAAHGALHASTQFTIPYVRWGMKDPSTFLLHVADTIQVEIETTVNLTP
jgi:polyisoprenoid-binding protein YceI